MSTPSPDFLHQLRNGEYDALQTYLSDLQQRFEAGQEGEFALHEAYRAFDVGDTNLGEKFGEWFEAKPGSYPAHVAFAIWIHRRGRDLRGGATANLVSDQGMRGMIHCMQQAEGASRHATTLTQNPVNAWLVVGDVRGAFGCELAQADIENQNYPDWYAEPLALNPHSFALRRMMLNHLRTEWGGSDQQMLTFVRQQQDSGLLSQDDMRKLWAKYHANVAHHEWLFNKDTKKALEHAEMAANLNEAHSDLLFALLTDMKRPPEERAAALERLVSELERHPENGLWYSTSALIEKTDVLSPVAERLGQVLLKMAKNGNGQAASALGLLHHEAPKLNFPDPIPHLVTAREQGDVAAASLLMILAQERRDLTASQKREHVLKAAEIGSDDASWMVYSDFSSYQKQFALEPRARYKYLLRSADAGNNDARFQLAQQLRAGFVEVGDDGVLRPVDTKPLQDSLDYAKHLLERAAAEGHKKAISTLKKAKERDWEAKTAKRLVLSGVANERKAEQAGPKKYPWYWLLFFLLALGKCASNRNHDSQAPNSLVPRPPAAVTATLPHN